VGRLLRQGKPDEQRVAQTWKIIGMASRKISKARVEINDEKIRKASFHGITRVLRGIMYHGGDLLGGELLGLAEVVDLDHGLGGAALGKKRGSAMACGTHEFWGGA
jgi:hypothetical protein